MKITAALCQQCGACCSQVVDGELVACRHLQVASGSYSCTIYETRPNVCRDYSCMRDGQLSNAVATRVTDALAHIAGDTETSAAPTLEIAA